MAEEEKKEKKEKKEKSKKSEKKEKEVKQITVKSSKANPKEKLDPRTGTRFKPGTARQIAFELILKMVKDGKKVKEIREALKEQRKENGAKFNLDPGYLNFSIATHPEMFEVYNNGTIKVVSEPKPDPEAAKKMEEELAAKKKKAKEAREKRKNKKEQKIDKKKGKKDVDVKE